MAGSDHPFASATFALCKQDIKYKQITKQKQESQQIDIPHLIMLTAAFLPKINLKFCQICLQL